MPQPTGHTAPVVVEVPLPRRFRYREFTLVPDTEPDAEPAMFAAQCCVCDERGELSKDSADAGRWALEHLKNRPDHFTYRALTTSPVRAQPGEWL